MHNTLMVQNGTKRVWLWHARCGNSGFQCFACKISPLTVLIFTYKNN